MSSRNTGASLWLALALILLPFSATAHSGQKDCHGKGACKADVEKYCSEVKPGEGRILACLKEHQSQLQTACQERLPAWEKFQQMRQTCKADREKFCGQAKREEVHACMKENHDKLSKTCRAAIDELKAWKKSPPATDLPPAKTNSGPSASL
jgi:cysteine rich repeat protein